MYKVNATRVSEGKYELSYGRGARKLTAIVSGGGSDGWRTYAHDGARHPGIPGEAAQKTFREAKEAWGKWAAPVYDQGVEVSGEPGPCSPPATHLTRLPPKFSIPRPKPTGIEENYTHDPFDERFRDPATKKLTPLGLLVEIDAWHQRYADRITKINDKLAESSTPAWNPFEPLIADVRRIIAQECPERATQETDRVESITPPSPDVEQPSSLPHPVGGSPARSGPPSSARSGPPAFKRAHPASGRDIGEGFDAALACFTANP